MLKEIVLIEWIAVNGLALVVWLAARRHEGLQKRLRALPVLKVFHEVELTRMERLHLVFALSMTALPVCGLATGAAGIVLALPFLFPKGCLASLVVHLVIYGFYRVARKHPTAREWGFVEFLGDKEPFGVVLRLTLSAVITLGCIVLTLMPERLPV